MSTTKQIRLAIANHGLALIAAMVVLFCFMWMTTYGTFELFEPEHFGQFYDAQAASLLAGHWDVAPKDIFPEGFYHDGKAYGYFGFVPAIPRMLLNRILPRMIGAWSRLSMIVACAFTLQCCYAILRRVRHGGRLTPVTTRQKIADAAFLLLAGLGSTVIYLGSRAFIYHEAVLWGVALALACYVQLFDYLAEPKWQRLFAASALAFLSFFTRISSGLGPILALLLLTTWIVHRNVPSSFLGRSDRPQGSASLSHVMLIITALATIAATYVTINHAKFGTWFQPAPMRLHEQVALDPSRFSRTGGKWMAAGNVPTVVYAYLSPGSIVFDRAFPWVFLQEHLRLFPGQHIDRCGVYSSITAAMPVFVILGVIGVGFLLLGRPRGDEAVQGERPAPALVIVLLATLAPIAAVLAFSSVDNRYLHEFFPFLIVTSAIGMGRLSSIQNRRLKRLLVTFLLIGGLLEIYVNCAFALVYQRMLVYDAPVKPAMQFRHWQQTIDRLVQDR